MAHGSETAQSNELKGHALRRGVNVIVALGILTAVEFLVAVTMSGNPLLAILTAVAVIKAGLILQYFMHSAQLWGHITRVWAAVNYELED